MNVIWVISDTLRCDHLGAYGNKTIHTPSLDAFAAKSVRFDRHYIAGFPTMPTRADYLTGRWTMSYMEWAALADDEVLLSEILARKGIHTAAIVDTPFYIRNGMNYDRGFMTFIEVPGQTHYAWVVDPDTKKGRVVNSINGGDVKDDWRYESDYCAPKTFTRAMEWLERHYREDFFLCIDTWDPHEPWEPPQYYRELYWPGHDGNQAPPLYSRWQDVPGITEEMVKKAHASYCGEITMVDTWFGYLMRRVENMGLMKNTAILFTSDHGYYFGEHGGLLGKMVMARDKKTGKLAGIGIWSESPFYEEVTHTPLLIYMPGVYPAVYEGLTSAVDLMPTVLEMMGQEIPSRVDGRSLLPMLKNPSIAGRNYVVSAHPFLNAGDSMRSVDDMERITEKDSTATVTTPEWALLYTTDAGLSELYNLKTDPKQEKNIIREHPDKANELHQLLIKFMRENNMPDKLINPRLHLEI
jgi:arylsulfatase A-like enzyme